MPNQNYTLIINHPKRGEKVLTSLLSELETSIGFYFSVAFITTSGVACIIEQLKRLEEAGVKGKILTSQYLNFTQPDALARLLQFANLEVRIETRKAFHSKGYLFEKEKDKYNLVLGSSNLTQNALTTNVELNISMTELNGSDELVENYLGDFQEQWQNATLVNGDFISEYRELYERIKDSRTNFIEDPSQGYGPIVQDPVGCYPNLMQKEALKALDALRAEGQNKALVISATGTGKTFLSAFDVKYVDPKRVLFIVHRQTIAQKSLETYKLLMPERTMALYSGAGRKNSADFLFATVQSVSNDLLSFEENEFDYIIIDESHRAKAGTYRGILTHFKPFFLLGMTATPERTDGADIFELFDHNIAYEIRLHRALEEKMLVPFHYYGVTDLTIDGAVIDDKATFNNLITDERVNHILKHAAFYGASSNPIKGLVFCSRKEEARELSEKFIKRGLSSLALTGDSTNEERTSAIECLENGTISYLITVDIFNEGIDIPTVNQILMLRPTQSAIIFVQQLGRGLRIAAQKEYLTVVDFIGNYSNSYLVPIALYGDITYNKDNLRKLLVGKSQSLPGACTIDFDRIAQEQIFESINVTNMRKLSDLKKDYFLLKAMLGRVPMMMDFVDKGSRDPFQFVEYSGSYFEFVKRVDPENAGNLSAHATDLLAALQSNVNDAKKLLDSRILLLLIENERIEISLIDADAEHISASLHVLNLDFDTISFKGRKARVSEKLEVKIAILSKGYIESSAQFVLYLNEQPFKEYLLDSTRYSINKLLKQEHNATFVNGFSLYSKYTRRDALRLLHWDKNEVPLNIGGYKISSDKTNCPIFVTYHKKGEIDASIAYEDEFISRTRFKWMSKSGRTTDSKDVKLISNARKNGLRMPFLMKKDDKEGIEFYYLGDVLPIADSIENQTMPGPKGTLLSVVKFEFEFSHPVAKELYDYLIS